MSFTGLIILLLIVANVVVSYKGFTDSGLYERYAFEVDRILVYREYKRLVTSGFLHVGWLHLVFNMMCLYSFGTSIGFSLGTLPFLLVYFASLIGGGLFSLLIHRRHGDYGSVGASGAICGLMFAAVALFPGMNMGLFFLPIQIPGWLFALLFVLFSIYGIRSQKNNVGYDAHLGGALTGMIVALLIHPSAFLYNLPTILIILIPTLALIYLIVTRPGLLLVDNLFFKTHKDYYSIDHRYNVDRTDQQQEVDRILEKISRKGMKSLTRKERNTLEEFSKQNR
jgi:membrane associated rhomboid family serine protease